MAQAHVLGVSFVAERGGIFHPPEDRERVVTIALSMLNNWLGRDHRRQAMENCGKHQYTRHLAPQTVAAHEGAL